MTATQTQHVVASSDAPAAATPAMAPPAVILRIKRKRGQEPVDALYIDALLQADARSAEETLAGAQGATRQLALPSRATKRRITEGGAAAANANENTTAAEGRGVFRLAETVSLASFNDPAARLRLHKRMAQRHPSGSPTLASSQSSDTLDANVTGDRLDKGQADAGVGAARVRKEVSGSGGAPPLEYRLVRSAAPTKAWPRSDVDERNRARHPGAAAPAAAAAAAASAATTSASSTPKSSTVSSASSGGSLTSRDPSHLAAAAMAARGRMHKARKSESGLRSHASSSSLRRSALRQPPKVARAKKHRSTVANPIMRIIDAVAITPSREGASRKKETPHQRASRDPAAPKVSSASSSSAGGKARETKRAVESDMDVLDRKFADLLGDYLRESNLEPPHDLEEALQKQTSNGLAADDGQSRASAEEHGGVGVGGEDNDAAEGRGEEETESESEYVYDVYYRDRSHWGAAPGGSGAAEIGLEPATVAGRGSHDAHYVGVADATTSVPSSTTSTAARGGAEVPAEWTTPSLAAGVGATPMARLVGVSANELLLLSEDEASWQALQAGRRIGGVGAGVGEDVGYGVGSGGVLMLDGNGELLVVADELVDDDDVGAGERTGVGATLAVGGQDEWDEGEDEDSNDESYYKNDYPDRDVDDEDDDEVGDFFDEDEGDLFEDDRVARLRRRDSDDDDEADSDGVMDGGKGTEGWSAWSGAGDRFPTYRLGVRGRLPGASGGRDEDEPDDGLSGATYRDEYDDLDDDDDDD